MSLAYRIHRHDTLGSTNDEAKRLADLGEPEGTVVTAETQTAGRGRSGRAWVTPRGAAIAMSVVLRPAARLPAAALTHVALLGGLATAEAIEQTLSLRPALKWPNDVMVRGKKVAGVLAEARFSGDRLEYAILGIGVNVNAGPPPELRLEYETTSLMAEQGSPLDRESLEQAILSALDARYAQLGAPALASAWSERLAMRGEAVRVIGPAETVTGVLEAVRDDGALILRMEDGAPRIVLAGDVHLRGAK
jgi:BirA family biotin operon repressor/biotin-[acetyl-CoA-carboxylase] ligase